MAKIKRYPRLDTGAISADVIEQLNKKYKKDKKNEFVLEMLSDSVFSGKRPFLPTGIPPLDAILSCGQGFPTGIVEIYGPFSSGKSALTEKCVLEAQNQNWYIGFFCAEYSLNYDRCVKLGIDPTKLIMIDVETIEDFYEKIQDIVRKIRETDPHTPILIVWDSIAATPSRTEMAQEKGLDDNEMAKLARQMSKFFKRMTRFLFKNKVCLLAVNQTRSNIGVRFGNPETTSGGKALGFYAWIRLRLGRIKTLRDSGENSLGYMIEAKTTKNKTAAYPDQKCKFPIYWSHGIDSAMSTWEYCVDYGIFKKDGTKYTFRKKLLTKKTFPKFYRKNRETLITKILELQEVTQ